MVQNLYSCDLCKSVGDDENYRLDGLHFHNVAFSIYPSTGGNPHMMPGGINQSTSKAETYLICAKCLPTFQESLLSLFAQFKPVA